jgi:hypothetical protein
VLTDQLVEPTIITPPDFEQSEVLAVTDAGELVAADEDLTTENGLTRKEEIETSVWQEEMADEVNIDTVKGGNEAETLEDEIAKEEFISDEIFVAEDEAAEEEIVEQELLQKDADDDVSANEDVSREDENAEPSDDEKVNG